MSVNSIYQSVGQIIPSREEVIGKCYKTFSNAARNLNKIAVPAITLFALSNLPGADGGPLEYSGCVLGCTLFATPVAFPGCITACLPLLFLPTP